MGDVVIQWPGPGLAGILSPSFRTPTRVGIADGNLDGALDVDIAYEVSSVEEVPADDSSGHYVVFWVVPTGVGLRGLSGEKRGLVGVGAKEPAFSKTAAEWGVDAKHQRVRAKLDLATFNLPAKSGDAFDLVVAHAESKNAEAGAHIISVKCVVAS